LQYDLLMLTVNSCGREGFDLIRITRGKHHLFTLLILGTTGVSWALLVYMGNCKPTLLVFSKQQVKLVDRFKTMELLNNRYAFYMLGRG